MASHVVVTATDLRRATIKVNPGTYLIDVLEEACRKLNLPSDKYLLKHKNKQLDLTTPFRTAGLTGGAKLDLIVKSSSPSVVTVALKLPDPEATSVPNGRLTEKFRSDTTLWKMLRHFENVGAGAGKSLNITARGIPQTSNGVQSGSGQLFYETPVLLVIGRELSSLVDFQKTLSQVGINSGNVLIHLTFKKTERTLQEAMQDIERFFKEVEADEAESKKENVAPVQTVPSTQPATSETVLSESQGPSAIEGGSDFSHPVSSAGTTTAASDAMEIDSQEQRDPLRPVGIFLAPTSSTPAAASLEVADSVYQPTIAHAQLHQQRLQDSSHNKRLLSDRELAEQAAAQEAKLSAIKSVAVKVRFPDETSAQWSFTPEDTGATLYKAVRSVMADDTTPFKLVLPGGKGYVADASEAKHNLIRGYHLEGRVLVNVVWDDSVPETVRKQPFLKSSVASRAKKVEVPDIPQGEEEPEEKPAARPAKAEGSRDNGEGSSSGKKLPKWLKLGKK